MLINYIRLALRNIARKRLYTFINLAGLSVASAFCILTYWYVQHERSFDGFHRHSSQLYRLEFRNVLGGPEPEKPGSFFSFMMKDANQRNMIQTPPILAAELKKQFPEIDHAVRVAPWGELKVRVGDQSFKEENNAAYVDQDFFSVFSFPLKQGNPATVLAGHNNVVLTEKLAEKYFGHNDPIGRTILLPNEDSSLFTVSGVAANFPVNSSFRYDIILPRNSTADYQGDIDKGLGTFSDPLVLELKPGTDIRQFDQKLNAFGKQYFAAALKEWASFPGSTAKPELFHIFLRPFTLAHYNISPGWGHYTDLKNIFQFISLAIVILLIACLNYVLLTLTGTVSRSQEVGIRKTVGAEKRQIILQFYVETQLLALTAVLIGFLLSVICLPLFNRLIGAQVELQFFSIGKMIIMLGAIAVALGLIAGIYPALVMAGLKPLNMLRKFSAYRLNPYFSRIMIVTQFSVCIILIISTLAIARQMRFINQKDLGFDREEILTINNPFGYGQGQESFLLRDRLAHFASTESSIQDFGCNFLGYNNLNTHLINGERIPVEAFEIDYNYFSFFKIPIIKGRSFSPEIASDSASIVLSDKQHMTGASSARQAAVVNETLYKLLGNPPLNEINRELGGPIVGVCKDYNPDDLTKKVSPAYHKIRRGYLPFFSFKIKAGQNIPAVMDKIRSNWNQLTGGEPFSYTFLDETVAKNYEAYRNWMKTVSFSCILAILIACLGLFGLSGLTTVSRVKEIGIRKILGASVSNLFLMLNRGTLVMALISFVIAVPIAIYLVNSWLQNFAYRITLGWPLITVAGIISIGTALVAVSYHTIKTAISNPVKSLRTD